MPGSNFNSSIELSKTGGVTVLVKNELGTISQTIALNGSSIVLTVKDEKSTTTITQTSDSVTVKVAGPAATSTTVQKPESVTITCQTFEINADTVKVTSTKDTNIEATGKLALQSTQDMSLSSSAKFSASSVADMTLSAKQAWTAEAATSATVKGQNVACDATVKATVHGASLVKVSGLKVDVAADTQVNVAAPIANVGDTLTTISGKLVKVEGALVKLG